MCKKPTRRKLFQSSPVERRKRGAGERRRKEQKDNRKKREGAAPSSCLLSSPPVLCASVCESWRLARSSRAGGLFAGSGKGVAGCVGSGVEGGVAGWLPLLHPGWGGGKWQELQARCQRGRRDTLRCGALSCPWGKVPARCKKYPWPLKFNNLCSLFSMQIILCKKICNLTSYLMLY